MLVWVGGRYVLCAADIPTLIRGRGGNWYRPNTFDHDCSFVHSVSFYLFWDCEQEWPTNIPYQLSGSLTTFVDAWRPHWLTISLASVNSPDAWQRWVELTGFGFGFVSHQFWTLQAAFPDYNLDWLHNWGSAVSEVRLKVFSDLHCRVWPIPAEPWIDIQRLCGHGLLA